MMLTADPPCTSELVLGVASSSRDRNQSQCRAVPGLPHLVFASFLAAAVAA